MPTLSKTHLLIPRSLLMFYFFFIKFSRVLFKSSTLFFLLAIDEKSFFKGAFFIYKTSTSFEREVTNFLNLEFSIQTFLNMSCKSFKALSSYA